jgi:dolichyl-diphosphooligosaccharide--protein glycosyltransferase
MVRLMLTLTPIVCVAAAMAISTLLDTYLAPISTTGGSSGSSQPAPSTSAPLNTMLKKSEKRREFFGISTQDVRWAVIIPMCYLLVQFVLHSTWLTSNAYSSPSIVLASKNPGGSQHMYFLHRRVNTRLMTRRQRR